MFTERGVIVYFWLAVFGFEISSFPIMLLPWASRDPDEGSAALVVFIAVAFLLGLVLGYGSFYRLNRYVRGRRGSPGRESENADLGNKSRFVFTCAAGLAADWAFCVVLMPLLLDILGVISVHAVLKYLDIALVLMCFHLRNLLNSRAYRLSCVRFGFRKKNDGGEQEPGEDTELPEEMQPAE
ncbi:MAG: hypothetical protein IJG63_00470 [Oscillospiraceae bacterium]|nr:hypothetical protein [Oscillospiraceae bacterium]